METSQDHATGDGGHRDDVAAFIEAAKREGLISESRAAILIAFHLRRSEAAAPIPPTEPPPVLQRAEFGPRPHPAFSPRPHQPIASEPRPPVTRPPAPPVPPQPIPAPPRTRTPARAPTPPVAPAGPVPVPRPRHSRAQTWGRFLKMRSKKLWGTFTADFAANAFTYLGVLLAVVVLYVFFAFGYFGEIVDDNHKQFRPLVEIGVVLFFLGLAWLLRHRSGIPQTATAVELIGVVLVPIMLAASFRDGCTPSYRPYCLPPDLDGPVRWAGYGIVGFVTAAVYYLFARRRRIYAYLVAPILWMGIGAFALYLEDGLRLVRAGSRLRIDRFTADGISGAQLIAVLVAIAVSVTIAGRLRDTVAGRRIAVPTVRAAAIVTPFVLVLTIVFAYNDAVVRGITAPDLGDLAWPNVTATALAAAIFGGTATARYAWDDLGPRLRRDVATVLRVVAYLALAASWLLTAGFGVTPAWLGAGLVGYAVVVAVADRYIGRQAAAGWIARTAGLAGAALSLQDPGATLAAWIGLSAIALGRAASPRLREATTRFLPISPDPLNRKLELWVPLLVASGAGTARLGWPEATPFTLLAIAVSFALTRFLPARLPELRSLAGIPAVAAAAGALGVEMARQLDGAGLAPHQFSLLLVALAATTAATTIPAVTRTGAATGLSCAAAMISLREALGATPWSTAWIDTAVLAAAGLALVSVALLPALRSGRRVYGTLGHLLVVAALARSLQFEQTAVLGLAALVVAYGAEAVAIEFGRPGTFAAYASLAAGRARVVEAIPTLVVLVALTPLTLLVGRRVPLVATERPRFGPLLAALSWAYAAAAFQRRTRARQVAAALAYAAMVAAVAVSAPSITAALATTTSAAGVSAVLAWRARRPRATTPAWLFAVAALLLGTHRAGIAGRDLYLVLHAVASTMILGAAVLNRVRRRQVPGLGSTWLVPPVFLGTMLLPAALALAVADGGWLAWVAVSSAAVYAALGWSVGAGGVSIPAAGAAAIGYAAILVDNGWAHPFDQPLSWMPYAAALIGLAAALPGNRRWRILIDPAPGLFVSSLGIVAMALVFARPAGVLDIGLAITSGLLVAIAAARRERPWLLGAGVTLVAAGIVAGDHWAPAATFGATVVTGYFADRNRAQGTAGALRLATAAGLGATFGLTASWQGWSAARLTAAAGTGALVVLAAATAISVAGTWPRRIRGWEIPIHALGQGLVAATLGAAAIDMQPAVPAGTGAALALLESVVFGIIGTVRTNRTQVAGAATAAAIAYGLLTVAAEWTATQVVAATAAVGALLLAAAASGWILPRMPRRVALWRVPALALGQAAAVAVVVTAADSLAQAGAAGVAAGVLGYEALLLSAIGTVRADRGLVAGGAALAGVAYGFVPQWLGWTRHEFVAITAAAAVLLAAGATAVTRLRRTRLSLWMAPLHALTVAAAAATAAKIVSGPIDWRELWMLSGVVAGLGLHAAINAAAAPPAMRIRALAVTAWLVAGELALTAEVEQGGALLATALAIAAIGVVVAAGAGISTRQQRPWSKELLGLGVGLQPMVVIATLIGYGPYGAEMGAVLVVSGAAVAAFGLLAPRLAMVEAAVVIWLGALLILVNQRIELPLHVAVAFSAGVLLAVVEVERHRRRQAGAAVPPALFHIEWVLMLVPLTLATADMFNSLWFGLVLCIEGVLLTSWGAATQVRRRALVGSAAIALAIVLAAVIPAIHGIQTGLTGGTWLSIGAVAALVFMVAGSTIERRRHAIGRRLAHLGEILERWE